jgi:uncharacterized protein YcbK (DUF882 family)
MSDIKQEFNEWFSEQGFKYFKAHEFTNYFERDLNTFPPKTKWKNIIPTMRVLDKLRSDIGLPIRITSSYRSNAYNKNCGGASKSLHKEFKAIDLQCDGARPSYIYNKLLKMRKAGDYKGGLSEYSTFTHIDTRGTNADW